MQSNQQTGLMQSVPLEPSPVQSNTTFRQDRLSNAVQAVLAPENKTATTREEFNHEFK